MPFNLINDGDLQSVRRTVFALLSIQAFLFATDGATILIPIIRFPNNAPASLDEWKVSAFMLICHLYAIWRTRELNRVSENEFRRTASEEFNEVSKQLHEHVETLREASNDLKGLRHDEKRNTDSTHDIKEIALIASKSTAKYATAFKEIANSMKVAQDDIKNSMNYQSDMGSDHRVENQIDASGATPKQKEAALRLISENKSTLRAVTGRLKLAEETYPDMIKFSESAAKKLLKITEDLKKEMLSSEKLAATLDRKLHIKEREEKTNRAIDLTESTANLLQSYAEKNLVEAREKQFYRMRRFDRDIPMVASIAGIAFAVLSLYQAYSTQLAPTLAP